MTYDWLVRTPSDRVQNCSVIGQLLVLKNENCAQLYYYKPDESTQVHLNFVDIFSVKTKSMSNVNDKLGLKMINLLLLLVNKNITKSLVIKCHPGRKQLWENKQHTDSRKIRQYMSRSQGGKSKGTIFRKKYGLWMPLSESVKISSQQRYLDK